MDELCTTRSPERVEDYLRSVYEKMAEYTTDVDHVTEVCTRHDRGVISREIIPHAYWTNIDRDPKRPGMTLDVLEGRIPVSDVLISTAVLHHTPPEDIGRLLNRLCDSVRRLVILSGPCVRALPELFGDHLYHIDGAEVCGHAHNADFRLRSSRMVGLSEPYSEILLVFEREE